MGQFSEHTTIVKWRMIVLVFFKFRMKGPNILLWLKCKETLNHYYIYSFGSKAVTIKLSYLNINVFDKLINRFVSQDKYGFISRMNSGGDNSSVFY